jgi:hypothetical protein
MSELENNQHDALMISTEIARTLIGLGVDWEDESVMRSLAREALDFKAGPLAHSIAPEDFEARAKQKLFGLVGLMLRTMQEGAEAGVHIHGSDIWKSFAKALWAEKDSGA